jgi:hypothetical protein
MSLRRILVDGRTPVNYTMFAPIHRALERDSRIATYFIASEEPSRAPEIFRQAGPRARITGPVRAALMKFHAYVASDFMWTPQPRGTCRIQMFHGVGGKYGFDAPTESMRPWHRLFFVNRRRLRNFVAAGAIDAGSPSIRLIGMPKVDCLVDGSLSREALLTGLGLPASRPTVLYAPTWSPASSLNALGVELIRRLGRLPVNVIVKLHDRSRDPRPFYSGGVDWPARLAPLMKPARVVLAQDADICPYLAAADVMITDHSSSAFEYLLLDRPLVRIHVPELIARANIHADYVSLLSSAADSVEDAGGAIAAVERALNDPAVQSGDRRAVAAELFHQPGTATHRAVAALYEAIELESPAASEAGAATHDHPVSPVVQLE